MKTNNNTVLFKGLRKFEKNLNYEIIREYTDDTIYRDINSWLLNLDELAYDKSGYFIGQLMYKLNEYGKKEINSNINQSELYRGMYIDYLDALSYEIYLGKIICFQTFVSSSLDEEIAKGFAKFRLKPEERKRQNKLSVFIKINQILSNDLYPLSYNISNIAIERHRYEKECLFHPFTFFKLVGYKIDLTEFKLYLVLESIGKKEIFEPKIKSGYKIKYDSINNLMIIDDSRNNILLPVQNQNFQQGIQNNPNEDINFIKCFII